MISPLCIIRSIWYTITTGKIVSGHDFRISTESTPKNIQVLVCRECGATSTSWTWGTFTEEG